MLTKVTLHGKNGSRVVEISTRGFTTRHVRTRVDKLPKREASPPAISPAESPAPVCPVLAALHKLQSCYGGDGYFILDEIFRVARQECSISRDALLETLRAYYRDGKILFRPGYGSQLQFALKEETA